MSRGCQAPVKKHCDLPLIRPYLGSTSNGALISRSVSECTAICTTSSTIRPLAFPTQPSESPNQQTATQRPSHQFLLRLNFDQGGIGSRAVLQARVPAPFGFGKVVASPLLLVSYPVSRTGNNVQLTQSSSQLGLPCCGKRESKAMASTTFASCGAGEQRWHSLVSAC